MEQFWNSFGPPLGVTLAPSGAQGGSKWGGWNWNLALRQPLGSQLVPKRPSCSSRAGPRAPWRHPNGHKMTPKGLQISARAPKIGPRAPKIDPRGPQTDPQTFKMDALSSKSRPPRLPQSTPWSRFSVLCSQLTSGLFVHQNCFLNFVFTVWAI